MNKTELKVEMLRNDETIEDLAKILGITRPTLSAKIHSRNKGFSQKEIAAIRDHYNLSPERVAEIFFAN
ncbi:MAG: XRE family transcriptional regulator [Clostridia bacterium]|nr:XRE family transcriptional regulator [Clostridia bacterium]